MGIEYYAFAMFIAALVCLIAILFKVLFTDVRRQSKLLDEKETKLLQLYRSFENIMEEFNDQVKTAMEDIREYEHRAMLHAASLAKQAEAKRGDGSPASEKHENRPHVPNPPEASMQPKPMTVDSSRIRAASEVLERAERMVKSGVGKAPAAREKSDNGEVIQRLFDDTVIEMPVSGSGREASLKHARREAILALAEEGKTDAQIARELSITRNEVKLVIDLGAADKTKK